MTVVTLCAGDIVEINQLKILNIILDYQQDFAVGHDTKKCIVHIENKATHMSNAIIKSKRWDNWLHVQDCDILHFFCKFYLNNSQANKQFLQGNNYSSPDKILSFRHCYTQTTEKLGHGYLYPTQLLILHQYLKPQPLPI